MLRVYRMRNVTRIAPHTDAEIAGYSVTIHKLQDRDSTIQIKHHDFLVQQDHILPCMPDELNISHIGRLGFILQLMKHTSRSRLLPNIFTDLLAN